MKKSIVSGGTDIPPHEWSIKITDKGELLWKRLKN